MRERFKPQPAVMQTPEQMQAETVAAYRKSVADLEAGQKKSDASMKAMYDKMIADAKKVLKEAEDPNNKMITNYRESYPESAKMTEENNKRQLATWESKYPTDHMQFVKMRLQQFLEETKDINFSATTLIRMVAKFLKTKNTKAKAIDGRWAIEQVRKWLKQQGNL
jgi:hypothetical protein